MEDKTTFIEVTPDMIDGPDDKGRMPLGSLTDRELLLEIADNSRKVADLVEQFFGDLKSGKINPMQLITGMFRG